MEMERQRMLAAESEAKKEKLRIEREEKERVERVRREKELAEKKAREAEEKRLRKEEECVYVCFVAHPVEGNDLIETKSHPGEKLECARMFPDKAPESMPEKDYNAYIRGGTYFVVRSIAGQPADTAYLSFSDSETDTRRVMVREGETFNPLPYRAEGALRGVRQCRRVPRPELQLRRLSPPRRGSAATT